MKRLIPPLIALVLVCLMGMGITAQSDITPPVLADMTIEPARFDTSSGPQTVMITARITDDISGVAMWQVYWSTENTTQLEGISALGSDVVTGTVHDGWYEGSFRLPQYTAQGWWTIQQIDLTDESGNAITYFASDNTVPSEIYNKYRFLNGSIATATPTVIPTATPGGRIYLAIVGNPAIPTVRPQPTSTRQPSTPTPLPTATDVFTPWPTSTFVPTQQPGVCDCSGDLYNCPYFNTQVNAQACFEHCMNVTGIDIHKLDGDGNGVACESLP